MRWTMWGELNGIAASRLPSRGAERWVLPFERGLSGIGEPARRGWANTSCASSIRHHRSIDDDNARSMCGAVIAGA